MSTANLTLNVLTPFNQSFGVGSCNDNCFRLRNIDLLNTATGPNYVFLSSIEGWSYNWNPSQTVSINILGQPVSVDNIKWTFEPIVLGYSYIAGYKLTTNEVLSPSEEIKFAIQMCAPNEETTVIFRYAILKDSVGDNTFNNNINSFLMVSEQ